ncbi:MAG: hypothetical protein K2J27_07900 [Duncaniella sp.]|nr:hypothetical protein [Duncaniella sp.]
MDLSELLKSLSTNQKVLCISVITRSPIIYTIGYMVSPYFRILEMFPQIMFTAAYSIMTASIEAVILEFARVSMGFKRYTLFPSVYVIILLFIIFNLFSLSATVSLRTLIGFYILSMLGGICGVLLLLPDIRGIRKGRKEKHVEQKDNQATEDLD